MSAPPRRARGGGQPRRRDGIQTPPKSRGRGRGGAMASTNSKAETLLQGLQAGSLNQQNGAMRRPSPGEKCKVAHGVGMGQIHSQQFISLLSDQCHPSCPSCH
jgi:hypothetical protein